MSSILDKEIFAAIIEYSPLVSIDLLVENSRGEFLLGLRLNRPAKGYWFVPGGRIFKNETISTAFERLTCSELGVAIPLHKASHQGLYEHFYTDNVFGDEHRYQNIQTHYIVNVFRLQLTEAVEFPREQHGDYRWMSPQQLLKENQVHEHTKLYFR